MRRDRPCWSGRDPVIAAVRDIPWRRSAPSLLPYTQMRARDGELELQFDRDAYLADLRWIPTRDLVAELEALRYLAVDYASTPGDSREIAEIRVAEIAGELGRRQRLQASD